MKPNRFVTPLIGLTLLSACTSHNVVLDSQRHVTPSASPLAKNGIPPLPADTAGLPPPRPVTKEETYSVAVSRVPVQDLLFALARDARLNIDIHPGLRGSVTLNAVDQTLLQLLNRIARQVDMRFELDGNNLLVMPDAPLLRTYQIDYVNMARETLSTVSVYSQISAAGTPGHANATTGLQAGGTNGSTTTVTNTARNRFWDTLVQNLRELLRETVQLFPEGGDVAANEPSADARPGVPSPTPRETEARRPASVERATAIIANPETGVISVRATGRQHEKVQEFLTRVMTSARRQVLIEATIAEVDLSQSFQQGVDWSKANLSGYGWRLAQGAQGSISAPGASIFEIGYDSKGGSFSGAVRLLESFGNVKVLSSPTLSVLNNQTAVLKVVDNLVYFTIESQTNQNQNQTLVTYTSTAHTVPIGLVINVTPQIGEGDTVLLNLRPSLSRTVGAGALDPNPALKRENIENRIPVVRSREIESVLRVTSGNVAVMGGLMEDMLDDKRDTTPVLAAIPLLGRLFENRNDNKRKTELVIFVRPTIIQTTSLDGDYRRFLPHVPDARFFGDGPQSTRPTS